MGMGLDTRGIMDGFAKGFNMVEGYYDRKDERERRDRLDQQREEYRAWHRDRLDAQDQIAAENRQHEKNIEYITQSFAQAEAGVPFDDQFWDIVGQPRYRKADPRYLLSKQGLSDVKQGMRVANPDDPADINDPETKQALNSFYRYDINSDRNGKPLAGERQIENVYPGAKGGTIVSELKLSTGEHEPMTEQRGSVEEGDTQILQQPVAPMFQQVTAAHTMQQFLQTPKGQAAIGDMGRRLGYLETRSNPEQPAETVRRQGSQAPVQGIHKTPEVQRRSGGAQGTENDGGRALMEDLVHNPEGANLPHQSQDEQRTKATIPTSIEAIKNEHYGRQKKNRDRAQREAQQTKLMSDAEGMVLNYVRADESERGYAHYRQAESALKSIIEGDYPEQMRLQAVTLYQKLLRGTDR